jgi:hypothetical protein
MIIVRLKSLLKKYARGPTRGERAHNMARRHAFGETEPRSASPVVLFAPWKHAPDPDHRADDLP